MANLSVRYATALFELSKEDNLLVDFMAQATFLQGTFEGSAPEGGALRILTHPLIPVGEKLQFVDTVYGDSLHPHLLHFLKLTIEKNRTYFLMATMTHLVDMIKQARNQISARVVSAVPLTDNQKNQLALTLTKKLGKTVDIIARVDPAQIAGISIHVDGYFLDHTVKTRLKNMKELLNKTNNP